MNIEVVKERNYKKELTQFSTYWKWNMRRNKTADFKLLDSEVYLQENKKNRKRKHLEVTIGNME